MSASDVGEWIDKWADWGLERLDLVVGHVDGSG